MRDTGAGKFWVRGEAAVGCDEGRKFQRVWAKLARALRHAITQEFCLSFRVIYFFFSFLPLLHVLTASSLGAVGTQRV